MNDDAALGVLPAANNETTAVTTQDDVHDDDKGEGGAKGEDTGVKNNTVRLFCCYTPYDVEELQNGGTDDPLDNDDNEAGQNLTCEFNLEDISKQAEAQFGSSKDLQYYSTAGSGEWKPLDNLEELRAFQTAGQTIPIRVPEMYYDMDDENENEGAPLSETTTKMEEMIVALVARLKSDGFQRVSDDSIRGPNHDKIDSSSSRSNEDDDDKNDETMEDASTSTSTLTTTVWSTRDWVLAQAAAQAAHGDPSLRDLLLSHVHALEHMAECLHYDLLWNNNNDDSDDDEINDNDNDEINDETDRGNNDDTVADGGNDKGKRAQPEEAMLSNEPPATAEKVGIMLQEVDEATTTTSTVVVTA